MDKSKLISNRFLLRPIESDEIVEVHRLWTEEPVRRFLWDGEIIPLTQTEEIVERSNRLIREHGYGIWGVFAKDSTELLGFAGYWHFRSPPSLELLFGVAVDHWNRGIATEAAKCVIRYGFDALGFETIVASTDVANTASIRVLEKLGMSFDRREVLDGLDTVFYRLQRRNGS